MSNKQKAKTYYKSVLRKPEPDGFDPKFSFNQMQCKTLKIDDTFISLSAIYWSHIDELIKAFLNNHNTSFTSSKALETVLSSLNHISLKKVKFPALHSYCLQSQQYLRQTNITNQFKKKYASEVLAIETQEHKDAATKKGYRNAVLLSSRGADQYYEELVDEEEETIEEGDTAATVYEDNPFSGDRTPPSVPRLPTPDAILSSMMPNKINHVMSPIRLNKMDMKTSSNYVVNGINFTDKYTEYKKYAARKLEQDETLYFDDNFNETLSMSHVLWLDNATYTDPLATIFGVENLQKLERKLRQNKKPAKSPLLPIIIELFEDAEELDEINEKLAEMELNCIKEKDNVGEHLIQTVRMILRILPKHKMNEEVLEHELKDTYINPILNAFFSLQEKFKYRAPEQNLPERVYRTEFSKKPDAIVSTIVFSHFSYTKLVGEVKNETYQLESLAVLYDKYKLGIYGKDIVDKGVAKVILFQAVGFEIRFFACELIEDAFYVVVLLFTVKLPRSIDEILPFINEIHKLYQIRELLEKQCIEEERGAKVNWQRDTLDTPIFEDYIETNQNHIPGKYRKRFRDGSYVDI